MDTSEYLYTIAEVAVTLAGFSGIVVALLGHGVPWRENDRYGLFVVLVACAGALVFSLLPAGLLLLPLEDGLVWRLSAVLIGAFMVVGAAIFARLRRRMQPRLASVFWIGVAFSAAIGLTLLLAALSTPVAPGIVALALLWLLVLAFVQLATYLIAVASGRL